MSNNKQSSVDKGWLILPLLMFGICTDGSYEILIGWLRKSYTFKFNNNEQQ